MKYLKQDGSVMDADGSEDKQESTAFLKHRMADIRQQLIELPVGYSPLARANLLLQLSHAHIQLAQLLEAWDPAREAFDVYVAAENWEGAVQACEALFATEQPNSLAALGQGVWLSVTFPIDPELTVALLQHVVDETPDDSQGAAVAAAAAHYIVGLRAPEGKERENLLFYTNQMLATVARRQAEIHDQNEFDSWFKKLELHDPALFLPRLRNIVDVLVQDEWWIDRTALQQQLPVH